VLAAAYSAGDGDARVDSPSGVRFSGRNYKNAAKVLNPFLTKGLEALSNF